MFLPICVRVPPSGFPPHLHSQPSQGSSNTNVLFFLLLSSASNRRGNALNKERETRGRLEPPYSCMDSYRVCVCVCVLHANCGVTTPRQIPCTSEGEGERLEHHCETTGRESVTEQWECSEVRRGSVTGLCHSGAQ